MPSEEETLKIVTNLHKRDDRSAVILGAAYVESMLEQLIKARLRPVSREDENRMFDSGQNGFLSSFGSKIRLGYAMRLFEFASYSDMLLIADIRNVVAHSLHELSFQHELIIKDCANLKMLHWVHSVGCPTDFLLNRSIQPLSATPKEIFCATVVGFWWTMWVMVHHAKDFSFEDEYYLIRYMFMPGDPASVEQPHDED